MYKFKNPVSKEFENQEHTDSNVNVQPCGYTEVRLEDRAGCSSPVVAHFVHRPEVFVFGDVEAQKLRFEHYRPEWDYAFRRYVYDMPVSQKILVEDLVDIALEASIVHARLWTSKAYVMAHRVSNYESWTDVFVATERWFLEDQQFRDAQARKFEDDEELQRAIDCQRVIEAARRKRASIRMQEHERQVKDRNVLVFVQGAKVKPLKRSLDETDVEDFVVPMKSFVKKSAKVPKRAVQKLSPGDAAVAAFRARGLKEERRVKASYGFAARTAAIEAERVRAAEKSRRRRESVADRPGYAERVAHSRVAIVAKELFSCTLREQRDKHQRLVADRKERQLYKRLPKREREDNVRANRDKRVPIEPQGPYANASFALAGVGMASLAYAIYKASSKAEVKANEFTELLRDAARNLRKTVGDVLWTVPIVMVVYYVASSEKVTSAVKTLLWVAVGSVVGVSFKNVIFRVLQEGGHIGVTTQGGMVDVAGKLIATIMCFSVFKGKLDDKVVGDLMRRVSLLERASGGIDTFIEWAVKTCEWVLNQFERMFGVKKSVLWRDSNAPMKEWCKEVDETYAASMTCSVDTTTEYLNSLLELVQRGTAFKHIYHGTRMSALVEEHMVKVKSVLVPFQGALKSRDNYRQEPYFMLLCGAPGVGKTLLSCTMCAAIMLESGLLPRDSKPEVVKANMWQKGASDYWNGYASQQSVVIDDAFQLRTDGSDKENDFMTVIRSVSSWAFPLNFADLDSKGKIYFNSRFIYGSTNTRCIDSPASKCIYHPEAVGRRIAAGYELFVSPGYSLPDGKLNYAAFEVARSAAAERGVGIMAFPWHVWEVRKHNYMTGQSVSEKIPLLDMVKQCIVDIRGRITGFKKDEVQLDTFIDGIKNGVAVQGTTLWDGSACAHQTDDHDVSIVDDKFPTGWSVLKRSAWYSGVGEKQVNPFETVPQAVDRLIGEEIKHHTTMRSMLSKVAMAVPLIVLMSAGCMMLYTGVTCILQRLGIKIPARRKFKEVEVELQSAHERVPGVRNVHPRHKSLIGVSSQGATNDVVDNIYENSYKVIIMGVRDIALGQLLFLESTMAVCPGHFLTVCIPSYIREGYVKLDHKIDIVHSTNPRFTMQITVEKFLSLPRILDDNDDVCFIDFSPVQKRSHKAIVHCFITEADVKYVSGKACRLDIFNYVGGEKRRFERNVMTVNKAVYDESIVYGDRFLTRCYAYPSTTVAGNCGAPLSLINNSSFQGKTVVGMHVAGSEHLHKGYSNVLTREMIEKAIFRLGIMRDEFKSDLEKKVVIAEAQGAMHLEDMGSFLPICTVERPVVICPKSSIYATDDYGRWGECGSLPAHMSPVYIGDEKVYPMKNAVAPYKTEVFVPELPLMDDVMYRAMYPLTVSTVECTRQIFSFDEAVLGVPQLEYFRGIPRSTSPGYPYVLDSRDGKKEFFGYGTEYDLTSSKCDDLRVRVGDIIDNARRNVRLAHVYNDFLKDELRAIKKVNAVATRLISSAPIDYTVAWRMYFGSFSAAVMANHTTCGMAPGINYYTGWDYLARKLKSKGSKVFAGDFKGFDSSEVPVVHDAILKYINDWYADGDENATIRKVLWADLVHSRHIGGDGTQQCHIYQWNKSLPSGHPFTTIVNSMYSLFALVYCYYDLTGDLLGFWDHVYAVTYGDDNVCNPDDTVAEKFNQVTVAEAMKRLFNMTYTSDKKEGELIPYVKLDDVTFLKRSFRFEGRNCYASLDLESFLYIVYWNKNKREAETIRINNLELTLEELSLHTKEVWQEYSGKVFEALLETAVPKGRREQDSYRNIVKSRRDCWF